MLNRDALINANSEQVIDVALAIADRLQDFPQHLRLAGAMLFLQTCTELTGTSPQDVATVAGNIRTAAEYAEQPNSKTKDPHKMTKSNHIEFMGTTTRTEIIDGQQWFVGADVFEALAVFDRPEEVNDVVLADGDTSCGFFDGKATLLLSPSGVYKMAIFAAIKNAALAENLTIEKYSVEQENNRLVSTLGHALAAVVRAA